MPPSAYAVSEEQENQYRRNHGSRNGESTAGQSTTTACDTPECSDCQYEPATPGQNAHTSNIVHEIGSWIQYYWVYRGNHAGDKTGQSNK